MDKFPSYKFELDCAIVSYYSLFKEIRVYPNDVKKSHIDNTVTIPVSPVEAERAYWALRAMYEDVDTMVLLKIMYKAMRGADEA